MGVGSIFSGILLSNWMRRDKRQVIDILRIVVLISLYPTILQFTNILINDENSFTLVFPLLAGLAVTLASATILFKIYRRRRDGEILTE